MNDSPPRRPETVRASSLTPFKYHIFLALWLASLCSNFGGLIQSVGASWLMTSLSPTADIVALVQASTVLPYMLFCLAAGAAADVFDRRISCWRRRSWRWWSRSCSPSSRSRGS